MGYNKSLHSHYWLGGPVDDLNLEDRGTSTGHVLRLTAIKQSITNFVRILTGQNIPVVYSSGQDSYTDGKHVVLSASTKEKNLDAVVGLALHEGSHIKLTDFEFLTAFKDHGNDMIPSSLKTAGAALGMTDSQVHDHVRFLMNVIEDRRIDYFIYSTSPGYRPYYESMYDYYFRNTQIDYAIQLGLKRDPTVANYIFYVTNMANRWVDTRHLKGLSRIFGLIDLEHIDRLNDDQEALTYASEYRARYVFSQMPQVFQIACNVLEVIFQHAQPTPAPSQPSKQQQSGQGSPQQQQGPDPSKEANMDVPHGAGGGPSQPKDDANDADDTEPGDDEDDVQGSDDDAEEGDDDAKGAGKGKGSHSDNDEQESEDESDADTKSQGADADAADPDDNDEKNATDGQKRVTKHAPKPDPKGKVNEDKLKKAIKEQKDFLNGKVKKTRISKDTDQQVRAMEHAGATTTDIEHATQYGGRTKSKVLILRRLTREIMESGAYPFTGVYHSRRYSSTPPDKVHLYEDDYSKHAVEAGLRAGAILAQRLSIRNQTQITKFNRKPEGHLDKRRLHALGYDDRSVFFKLRETAFAPVFVHLTLDGSGSMHGERWEQALQVGIALAVAAEKIENLNVVLSVRAGVDEFATISILYDSRMDTTAKIKTLFPYLTTNGSTPEGLCYAAILDELLAVKATDRYFINLSDGEPCWTEYGGAPAYAHTREQVNIIRNEGIKVLSYFVGSGTHGSYRSSSQDAFTIMYGKDAAFIDVRQIPSLITTLNRLFLKR